MTDPAAPGQAEGAGRETAAPAPSRPGSVPLARVIAREENWYAITDGRLDCGHRVPINAQVIAYPGAGPGDVLFACSPGCAGVNTSDLHPAWRRSAERRQALVSMSRAAEEHLVGLEVVDAIWVLNEMQREYIKILQREQP